MGHTRHADGMAGCITVNYKTVFLYSDWVYFLWHGTCTCIKSKLSSMISANIEGALITC